MTSRNESIVEAAVLEWFEAPGYAIDMGSTLSPLSLPWTTSASRT